MNELVGHFCNSFWPQPLAILATAQPRQEVAEFFDAFCPQSRHALNVALDLWKSDSVDAMNAYGGMDDWDVSAITDMSLLFPSTSIDDFSMWSK